MMESGFIGFARIWYTDGGIKQRNFDMTTFFRKAAFSLALICLALTLGASPLSAETSSCKPRVKTHKVVHKAHKKVQKNTCKKAQKKKCGAKVLKKAVVDDAIIRIAQEHLAHLGYYKGKIDGKMGPATKEAIRCFQLEHGLKATGILDKKTQEALEAADRVVAPKKPIPMVEPVKPAQEEEVSQDYQMLLNGKTRTLNSRFAHVDVSEGKNGARKHYTIAVNGDPVLSVKDQSSVIGISKTYELSSEDAIIFTIYDADNIVCSYTHRVLVLNEKGSDLLNLENCTRTFEGQVNNDSLYLNFPEYDDGRVVGATWRLEGTSLNKL
jgi:peptidoglycan hydrolase-like protein with peptidoglycan-binding domain